MRKRKMALLLQGWKQCTMALQSPTRNEPHEWGRQRRQRATVATRGARCSNMVSPEKVRELGLAVCGKHEGQFLQMVEASVTRRQELRARLDPGCEVE
jgi:hypothetical protein